MATMPVSGEISDATHEAVEAANAISRLTNWSECTPDAEPLARLHRDADERIRSAGAALRAAPSKHARRTALAAWECAATDLTRAVAGWSGVVSHLAQIEHAQQRLRAAVEG